MQVATRRSVLELLRRGRAATRRDLGTALGLSRSAVAQLVAELLAEGLLVESPADRHERPGRPSSRLSLCSHPGWVAAVELRHHHLAVQLGRVEQTVPAAKQEPVEEQEWDWPVDESARDTLAFARRKLTEFLTRRGVAREALVAVGLCVPFPVVGATVRPVELVPGWSGVRPAELLGLPAGTAVVIDNDANLAAWGEYVHAPQRDACSLLYLMAGEGVGGGLVLNGEIYRGAHGVSGEIGHVRVPGCALPCRCGRVGCLDVLVEQAADSTDPAALADAGTAVGSVLAQISGFLDPDIVTLAGHLAERHPEFLAAAQAAFTRDEPSQRAVLSRPQLGHGSSLRGAFDLAVQQAWAGPRLVQSA